MSFLGKDRTPFNQVGSSTESAQWLPYGIGIDTHLKFAFVTVVVPDYQTGQVTNFYQKIDINKKSIESLEHWICEEVLSSLNLDTYNFVIESTSTYHFPFIRFFSSRMKPIVINPVLAGKDKLKTDKYDSKKLANHGMTGLWKPTPFVSSHQEVLRILTRTRKKIEYERTTTTNRIATRMIQYGITYVQDVRVSSERSLSIVQKIVEGETNPEVLVEYARCDPVHFHLVQDLPSDVKDFFALMLKRITDIDADIKFMNHQIKELIYSYCEDDYENLQSIPGVGPKCAEVILAELGDREGIKRFHSDESVCAYAGVSADRKVSAGKVTSHMRRGGNPWIKMNLVQSAQVVMRQDIPLAKWAWAIQHRNREAGFKKAVIAVASRLARFAYYVLKKGEPFDESKVDYKAVQKETSKQLSRISKQIDTIDVSVDDFESKSKATEVAFKLAVKLGGASFRYVATDELAKNDYLIGEIGIGKRTCRILESAGISRCSSLFVKIVTGTLIDVKGIGEASERECINALLELGLVRELTVEK